MLGLGNIGALAGKPVMEGKGCLFKKFAGIDVFDIEIGESDPDKIVEVVAALEPTFGGINLEDIKAPECFYIEKKLRERMKIPVFHDDQHGTAIVAAAAVLNGLKIVGKDIGKVKLVCSGAGAAAIACLDLQVSLGLDPANIWVLDSKGVIGKSRTNLDADKARYAQNTQAKTLDDVIAGCDVFLGLSGPRRAHAGNGEEDGRPSDHPRDGESGARDPSRAREGRATRLPHRHRPLRLSEPGQQLAVLPVHLPRRARLRRDQDQRGDEARRHARRWPSSRAPSRRTSWRSRTAKRRRRSAPTTSSRVPSIRASSRRIAPAVAQAQRWTAASPRGRSRISTQYHDQLSRFVYESGATMEPVFAAAKNSPKRVAYAEGEDERVLRAAQAAVDEGLARPVLVGRTDIIASRIQKLGLRLQLGKDCDGVNILDDSRYRDYWTEYYKLARRKGVTRAAGAGRHAHAPHAGGGHARPSRRCRRDAVRHRQQFAGAPALHPAGDRRCAKVRRRWR